MNISSIKTKTINFVNAHQVPVIIGSFLLLPVIVFGSVLLFLKIKNRPTNDIAITPTPSVTISTAPSRAVSEEPEEEEPTASPTKKLTQSPTPKTTSTPGPTSKPTNTPGPTSAPDKKTNIVFQSVNCTYTPAQATANPTAQPTVTAPGDKKINDVTFSSSSEVPKLVKCVIDFKNTENDETGDITYAIYVDSEQKKITVGKLKKDESKSVTEFVEEPKDNPGSHFIKVVLNPDRTFTETNYDDNTYQANYTVQ